MISLELVFRSDCPRYSQCSAMICPLDKDWVMRTHLPEERVCTYLREYYKEQGSIDNIPEFICCALDQRAEGIMKVFYVIRRSVILGSTSPSKISQFKQRRKVLD